MSKELSNDDNDASSDAGIDSDHMKLDMFDEIKYLDTDNVTFKYKHHKFIIIMSTEEFIKVFNE